MIDRRLAIRLACACLALAGLLQVSAARADPLFTRFLPFFVDLDGWQGAKADGMSVDMPGNSMTTAKRDYQRQGAQLHASVMVGQAAAGALAPVMSDMSIDTPEGHMHSSAINGLHTLKTYNVKDKSGAIMVALADNAMFTCSYSGLSEDEASALAQKFDLKAIRAAIPPK